MKLPDFFYEAATSFSSRFTDARLATALLAWSDASAMRSVTKADNIDTELNIEGKVHSRPTMGHWSSIRVAFFTGSNVARVVGAWDVRNWLYVVCEDFQSMERVWTDFYEMEVLFVAGCGPVITLAGRPVDCIDVGLLTFICASAPDNIRQCSHQCSLATLVRWFCSEADSCLPDKATERRCRVLQDTMVGVQQTRYFSPPFKTLYNDLAHWPAKTTAMARTKINVQLRDLFVDLAGTRQYSVIAGLAWLMRGAYNDHTAAVVLWLHCLACNNYSQADLVNSWLLCTGVKAVKNITVLLKGLGCAAHKDRAMFVELGALRGRDVERVDYEKDVGKRVTRAGLEASLATVDEEAVRAGVRYLYSLNLESASDETDLDNRWKERIIWTANGSASKSFVKGETCVDNRLLSLASINKKVLFDAIQDYSPLVNRPPRVDVTFSEKLELGKSRALYASSIPEYYVFDQVLTAIERRWAGHRVWLDPGGVDVVDMYSEFAKNSFHVCIDYDDFNSQHSLSCMKIVFEELRAYTDHSLLDWTIASFDNMWLSRDAHCPVPRRWLGTLPSGHRATTFINSVLNFAYLYSINPGLLKRSQSVHVGDDMYSGAISSEDVADWLAVVHSGRVRTNPAKQIIGPLCGEFLRTSFAQDGAVGYLARSIGSIVSGNWTTEFAPSTEEYLHNLIGLGWTLRNRAFSRKSSDLLASAFERKLHIGLGNVRNLLSGCTTLDSAPSFVTDSPTIQVLAPVLSADKVDSGALKNLPIYGSEDYVNYRIPLHVQSSFGLDSKLVAEHLASAHYSPALQGYTLPGAYNYGSVHGRMNSTLKGVERCNNIVINTVMTVNQAWRAAHTRLADVVEPLWFPLVRTVGVDVAKCVLKAIKSEAWDRPPLNKATFCTDAVPYSYASSTCVTSQDVAYQTGYPIHA